MPRNIQRRSSEQQALQKELDRKLAAQGKFDKEIVKASLGSAEREYTIEHHKGGIKGAYTTLKEIILRMLGLQKRAHEQLGRSIKERSLAYVRDGKMRLFLKQEKRIIRQQIKGLFQEVLKARKGNKGSRSRFNTHWKALLKRFEGDKTALRECVHESLVTLRDRKLKSLAIISDEDLRGFDREGIKLLFKELKRISESRNFVLGVDLQERIERYTSITQVNGALKVLGGGAVNTVYSGTMQRPDGSVFKGVFKPEATSLPRHIKLRERVFGTAARAGIPVGEDAFLSERAIATYRLGEALWGSGESNNVVVRTEFAVLSAPTVDKEGKPLAGLSAQRGIVMEMASGGSPKVIEEVQRPLDKTIPAEAKILSFWSELQSSGLKEPTPLELTVLRRNLSCRKLEFKNGEFIRTDAKIENLDPKNPLTMEGLIKLQCLDWITGESDRHPENYFVTEKGHVMAIDSDCSFGKDAVKPGVDVRNQGGMVPNNGSLMLRLTPVVTRRIADAVFHLTEEAIRSSLRGLVNHEEVDATLERWNLLKKHIDSNKCLIVDTAEALISSDVQSLQDSNNSYIGRELIAYQANAAGGWNYLRRPR